MSKEIKIFFLGVINIDLYLESIMHIGSHFVYDKFCIISASLVLRRKIWNY